MNLESGSGPADVASKYGGGEVRTALTAFFKIIFKLESSESSLSRTGIASALNTFDFGEYSKQPTF